VILLNSVLNSIPIFFLSFLKMSNGVWRHIVRIQRHYLWGRGREKFHGSNGHMSVSLRVKEDWVLEI